MKNHNLEKPVPGCLGAMFTLFDISSGVPRDSLTEKYHPNDCSLLKSKSVVARVSSPTGDHIDDKHMVSEFRKNSLNGKLDTTPMNMLISEAMTREMASKHNPPNLVAKLMGLESLPLDIDSNTYSRSTQIQSGKHQDFPKNEVSHFQEQIEYKNVYEIWPQSGGTNSSIGVPLQKTSKFESRNEILALIPQKFKEAKRLATNERFIQSEKFQDAVQVLNSNKELFVKVLREPNSMFSQLLHEAPPSTPQMRQITVLKPSKIVDSDMIFGSRNNREKRMKKMSRAAQPGKPCVLPDFSKWMADENPDCSQMTQIVILKPTFGKSHNKAMASSTSSSPRISKSEYLCRNLVDDEVYIGDESSFRISENEYQMGNLSDSDLLSPISGHRRSVNPGSFLSFGRASYSPESPVCREAKKRLSARLAMISSNRIDQEQKHARKNYTTLGEMLALSDANNAVWSDEANHTPHLNCDLNKDVNNLPQNLSRSKSVPASSALYSSVPNLDVSDSFVSNTPISEELTKGKNGNSSLKGKISSIFFSRNKNSNKEKSCKSPSKDEFRSLAVDTPGFLRHSSVRGNGDTSQCIDDLHGSPRQCIVSKESLSCISKHDQPSPNTIIVPSFEDDDSTSQESCSRQDLLGIQVSSHSVKPNRVEKSPPIESVARRTTNLKLSSGPLRAEEDKEKDWKFLVQSLLCDAGLDPMPAFSRWHSSIGLLGPTLREKYVGRYDKEPIIEAEKRQKRSNRKLVFDCVNFVLTDIGGHRPNINGPMMNWAFDGPCPLVDRVYAQIKEWYEAGPDEDDVSILVKEILGGGNWSESMREVESLGIEIGGKLFKELLEEAVVELTGNV